MKKSEIVKNTLKFKLLKNSPMIERVLKDELIKNYSSQNIQREKTISKDAFAGRTKPL